MQKESISSFRFGSMMVIFIIGSNPIIGVFNNAKQNAWIPLILSSLLSIPIYIVYARIVKLFPEKNLFEVVITLFGKIIGRVFIVVIVWYSLHLCAIVMRNFADFITIASMPDTPFLAIIIMLTLLTIYMVKSGIDTLSKWTLMALFVILLMVITTFLSSVRQMDFSNILPIMTLDFKQLGSFTFQGFAFPFAESVLFLFITDSFRKTDNPYKTFIYSILMGTLILLVIIIRNIALLGAELIESLYFPSYVAVRLIYIGEYLSRIEGSISMNFVLGGTAKISLCLMAATKGTAKLFGIQDHRQIAVPVGLLALAFSTIIYRNTMDMYDFIRYYPFYALPFQVFIPLLIWIVAEVRVRGQKGPIKDTSA